MSNAADQSAEADAAIALVNELGEILRGEPPDIVGAALADLLALWLASHVIPGEPEATETMRRQMLFEHLVTVKKLIPINAAQIGTDLVARPPKGRC